MKGKKLYEVECDRTNISPRQFYTYCKKRFEQKTGNTLDMWIDSFDDWEHPVQVYDDEYMNTWKRWDGDEDGPAREICKIKPFEIQLFLAGSYNFIMEWFDGHGYMFAVEFER